MHGKIKLQLVRFKIGPLAYLVGLEDAVWCRLQMYNSARLLLFLTTRSTRYLTSSSASPSANTATMSSQLHNFTTFKLAMIQLQPGLDDKVQNMIHTREMILKAAAGDGDEARRPDLIMLPVGTTLLAKTIQR